MSRKGCIVTVIAVPLVLIGVGTTLYYMDQNVRNPYYHGKRVNAWADQALQGPDAATRREATEALVAAFKEMGGDRVIYGLSSIVQDEQALAGRLRRLRKHLPEHIG